MNSKALLLVASLMASIPFCAFAGDSKDMKDMKEMTSPPPSDAGFYVAAYGGVNWSTDYGDRRTVISTPAGRNVSATPDEMHSTLGYVGGLKGGYNFDSFLACAGLRLQPAVEVEGMYIGSETRANQNSAFGSVNEHSTYNSGAGFVNGLLRIKTALPVTPYVGVGAGVQYITSHTELMGTANPHITGLGAEDVDFAAQALAGFDFKVADHICLFTEYKFIDALGTDLLSPSITRGSGFDYRFKPDQVAQQIAVVGVKYGF